MVLPFIGMGKIWRGVSFGVGNQKFSFGCLYHLSGNAVYETGVLGEIEIVSHSV